MIFDFVPVWTLILGLAVFFYVLLDGFDLGVGILYNFAPSTKARNLVIRIVERMFDRAGVLMLLALGLATAGATAGL